MRKNYKNIIAVIAIIIVAILISFLTENCKNGRNSAGKIKPDEKTKSNMEIKSNEDNLNSYNNIDAGSDSVAESGNAEDENAKMTDMTDMKLSDTKLNDTKLGDIKSDDTKLNDMTDLETNEKMIAITFDDGPWKDTTEKLLDGLKERGIKATFFLIGENAKNYPEVVKRMHDEGHIIGNHTYTHIDLSTLSVDDAKKEIELTNETLEQITGEKVTYIRPPYGKYSNKLLEEIDLIPVMWNVDPEDWNRNDVRGLVVDVVKHTQDRNIILLHDNYNTSVAAALEIIDELQAKGYIFVTVDQILLN